MRPEERIPYRGPLFHFFWPLTRYFIINLSAAFAWIYFNILNKTIVFNAGGVGEDDNTLILANHQTMIDGFLIGVAVDFPKSLIKPALFPWLPAAQENFYSNPILGWFSDNWKCVPIKAGRKDFSAMKRMINCLRYGRMIIFPEGTRSRTGELGPPRAGTAYVMLHTFPKTIPVAMEGMDAVQPVGSYLPRLFKTIYLYFGKPVAIEEFRRMRPDRQTSEKVIEKVFDHIRRQKKVLVRYRRRRSRLLAKKPFYCRIYAA